MDMLLWFSSQSIGLAEVILVCIVFTVALLNASIGPSGGILFATIATILPPAAVVPVHAVVQGGGAVFRFALLVRHVSWATVSAFVAGGIVGILVVGQLMALWSPPDDVLRLLLGTFILGNLIVRVAEKQVRTQSEIAIAGGLTSFLAVLVGATGSLVAAWLAKDQWPHRKMLGTYSACMVFQHLAKVVVFGALGFSFTAYGPLMAFLLTVTLLGSLCGKYVLLSISGHVLKRIFKIITLFIGGHLVVDTIYSSPAVVGSWTGGVMCVLVVGFCVLLGYKCGATLVNRNTD